MILFRVATIFFLTNFFPSQPSKKSSSDDLSIIFRSFGPEVLPGFSALILRFFPLLLCSFVIFFLISLAVISKLHKSFRHERKFFSLWGHCAKNKPNLSNVRNYFQLSFYSLCQMTLFPDCWPFPLQHGDNWREKYLAIFTVPSVDKRYGEQGNPKISSCST